MARGDCITRENKVPKRDPRTDPMPGDILRDYLGRIHVAAINTQSILGPKNVVWHRVPTGMHRNQFYEGHNTLTYWRKKVAKAEVVEAV